MNTGLAFFLPLCEKLISALFLFFSLIICGITLCQEPACRHYDVSSGLPTNEVYELVQDKKGFLWIGSDAGLVRYDGFRFRLFTNGKNRGPAISGLSEDKYGRIWCSNFSGQVFYTEGDSLYLFEPWEKRYKQNYADVTFDGKEHVYISNFQNKIYRYNIDDKKESIAIDDEKTKTRVSTAYDGKIIYTLLDSGLIKQMEDGRVITVSKLYPDGKPLPYKTLNNFVFYTSFERKQTLCFQRFNPGNPQAVLYYYKNNTIYLHEATTLLQQLKVYLLSCFDDDNGNLMVGTDNGLLWLKKDANGKWILYTTMLPGNGISYITKDREGSIWVSTLKNGIYKIANTSVWTIPAGLFNLRAPGINHISSDGKQLLFGTAISGEVFAYDINTHRSFMIPVNETRDAQALEYDPYTGEIFISKNSTIVYNPVTHQFRTEKINIANSKDFFFAPDGIVFATGGSLYAAYDDKNKNALPKLLRLFDTIRLSYDMGSDNMRNRMILSEQRNKAVWFEENTNTLWAGFVDGVVYYENKKPVKLIDPATGQPVIATSFAQSTGNSELYIATAEQGIYVVRNKKIVQQYNTSDGLLSGKIKRLHLKNGILWIIDGGAVQGLDIKTGKIKTINVYDGLQSSEIYDVEVIGSIVYVATSAGLQFFPENIETNNIQAPASSIVSLLVDEKIYSLDGKIALSPQTKNISVELEGIALKSDGAFSYQYRLLPADTNWITVGAAENKIRFSSLSPGTYTFQSRVMNEDGIMSKDISALKFSIAKYWWQQWWFLMICAVAIIAVMYSLFRARIKTNRKKADEEIARAKTQEELRQSQLASLKAQMNPHFMFNALNSIQEFILLNDKRQANMYMGKFADLMRMTLDMSNKNEISLEDEIKILNLYLELEALRFEENFQYTIEIEKEINSADICLPSMLIQPYVENAVKHGLLHKQGEKKLTVQFASPQTGLLVCTITDNGIGRKRSEELNAMRLKKYTSFATGATQKRLELLNQERQSTIAVIYKDLIDANGNAVGTKVTLNIPC